MSRRGLCILATLFVASAAQAAWTPIFQPNYILLRPGEATTVTVFGAWTSGIMLVPFQPWTFTSKDPTVASVEGNVPNANASYTLRIDAHRVGVTHARIVNPSAPVDRDYMLIVVAERYLPVSIGVNGTFAPGYPITLTAVSDEPDATFTWHWGKLGEPSWVVGTGREITFVPEFTAHFEYWVSMITPNGAGAASIVVVVRDPLDRRRSVRH